MLAAQLKNYISLSPMLKKASYFKKIISALAIILLTLQVISQNNIDTTLSPIILELNDTTYIVNDTLTRAAIDTTQPTCKKANGIY